MWISTCSNGTLASGQVMRNSARLPISIHFFLTNEKLRIIRARLYNIRCLDGMFCEMFLSPCSVHILLFHSVFASTSQHLVVLILLSFLLFLSLYSLGVFSRRRPVLLGKPFPCSALNVLEASVEEFKVSMPQGCRLCIVDRSESQIELWYERHSQGECMLSSVVCCCVVFRCGVLPLGFVFRPFPP